VSCAHLTSSVVARPVRAALGPEGTRRKGPASSVTAVVLADHLHKSVGGGGGGGGDERVNVRK